MPDEIYTKSVTKDELSVVKDGTVIRMIVPFASGYGNYANIPIPPEPLPYWSFDRDAVLRSTIHHESMWGAAVGIAITKMASTAFEVSGDIPMRVKRAQDMLLNAGGRRTGWVTFIAKHLRDFLTTDNSAFIEIVRATKSIGSRIIGINHLDSLRCTRTGDPDIPVLYRDLNNRYHEMKDYQIMMLSDMPDPGQLYNGVGACAASRAYRAIYKLAAIEWYLIEKVTGLKPLEIHIVNGMVGNQLQDSIEAARSNEISKGVAAYMGAVIVSNPAQVPPEIVTIPLADFPDKFNRKEEFDISILTYANSLGIDVQDLQPLTGQSLGSGAQSQVLEDKSKGKGLASWRQDFTHQLNEYLLDDKTTFGFVERDYNDMNTAAEISNKRATVAKTRIESTITTPAQELQILVDLQELPKEFLPVDETPNRTLTDTEKPESENKEPAADKTEAEEIVKPEKQPEKRSLSEKEASSVPLIEPTPLGATDAENETKAMELLKKTLGETKWQI